MGVFVPEEKMESSAHHECATRPWREGFVLLDCYLDDVYVRWEGWVGEVPHGEGAAKRPMEVVL